MNEFLKHLQSLPFELYEHGEYTNATQTVYITLAAAVFDKADTITIHTNYFEWSINNKPAGIHLGKLAPMPQPAYQDVFKLMQKKDEVLSNYTEIIQDVDGSLKVSLLHISLDN